MRITNRAARASSHRQAIAGIKAHHASTPSIVLDGVSYTPAEIEKALQDPIDAADATTAVAAAFHQAVALESASIARGGAVYRALRAFLINQHKTSPDTLAEFGVTLPEARVPDAATVAIAVKKRKATRAARHTMGKRQKATIQGEPANAAAAITAPASPPPAKPT